MLFSAECFLLSKFFSLIAFLHFNLSANFLFPFVLKRDVMWNAISGTIPKEIGNIKTLELL